jgi:hypothetical protein
VIQPTTGREILLRLELPLPLDTVTHLLLGIKAGAERAGYTDVVLLADGSNRVVATPPQ